jgi:hypothetical protein
MERNKHKKTNPNKIWLHQGKGNNSKNTKILVTTLLPYLLIYLLRLLQVAD